MGTRRSSSGPRWVIAMMIPESWALEIPQTGSWLSRSGVFATSVLSGGTAVFQRFALAGSSKLALKLRSRASWALPLLSFFLFFFPPFGYALSSLNLFWKVCLTVTTQFPFPAWRWRWESPRVWVLYYAWGLLSIAALHCLLHRLSLVRNLWFCS